MALITGCSSGFGLLSAVELARRGFAVAATMRNLARADRLDAALADAGVSALTVRLDVVDEASRAEALAQVTRELGPVDVLVNNAGYGIFGFAEDLSMDELRAQLETNFFGAVALCSAVAPGMRDRGAGRIINVSSLNGRLGVPGLSAYCASKFALEGYSECLRHELLPHGVHVTLVEPGTFRTEIFEGNKRRAQASETSRNRALTDKLEHIGIERARTSRADPRDVALAIAEAATARRPQLRMPVGVDARLAAVAKSVVPQRAFELATSALLKR